MTDVLGDPKLTWYLSRSTGLVCLVLLTLSLVLGITASGRAAATGWPRFLSQSLHRNCSLAVLALLVAHVVVVVLDDFVVITWLDAVVPFVSDYRPLWLGVGTLSLDLVVVLVLTSLARHRFGHGAWRAVHWTAYACWPLAVVHGLGTGSDSREPWALAITVGCVVVALVAICWRILAGWPQRLGWRMAAALLTAASVGVGLTWASQGPLAPGWSQRAGTPSSGTSSGG